MRTNMSQGYVLWGLLVLLLAMASALAQINPPRQKLEPTNNPAAAEATPTPGPTPTPVPETSPTPAANTVTLHDATEAAQRAEDQKRAEEAQAAKTAEAGEIVMAGFAGLSEEDQKFLFENYINTRVKISLADFKERFKDQIKDPENVWMIGNQIIDKDELIDRIGTKLREKGFVTKSDLAAIHTEITEAKRIAGEAYSGAEEAKKQINAMDFWLPTSPFKALLWIGLVAGILLAIVTFRDKDNKKRTAEQLGGYATHDFVRDQVQQVRGQAEQRAADFERTFNATAQAVSDLQDKEQRRAQRRREVLREKERDRRMQDSIAEQIEKIAAGLKASSGSAVEEPAAKDDNPVVGKARKYAAGVPPLAGT